MRRKTVAYGLRVGTQVRFAGWTCERHPERHAASLQQGDRRRAHRRSGGCAAVRGARRDEPRPRALTGKALGVEPGWLIFCNAGRQDLRLPRACRRFKPLEGSEDRRQRIWSFQSRVLRHPLPGKQKAQEVARRNRLDLGAQALDRVMVDAGKQPAVTPLFVIDSLNKSSTQDRAFDLQGRERARDRLRFKPKRRRERALGPGGRRLYPAWTIYSGS